MKNKEAMISYRMFVDYLVGIVVAIILLVIGFHSAFRPLKLIDFYKRVGSKRFNERLEVKMENYGFFLNLRICGIIFIISSLSVFALLGMALFSN